MKKLDICPSTLAEGFDGYSPSALKALFGGKKVPHVLQYDSPSSESDKIKEEFLKNRENISISGVQTKMGFVVDGSVLRLAKIGEQSTHILKPAIHELKKGAFTPANEHLTMQIASRAFGLETAINGLCFFRGGEAAYITRRFDIAPDGSKLRVEDFASLAGKSPEGKYDSSYEEIGEIIRSFLPPWRVEIEKFFRLVVFNYLFSNGDAHLKNFSIIETPDGDFKLAPAYDLMSTPLHIGDSMFALKNGLFKTRNSGNFSRDTFLNFADALKIPAARSGKILADMLSEKRRNIAERLIGNSFLSEGLKQQYRSLYVHRIGSLG